MKSFKLLLSKSKSYSQVIKQGKTILTSDEDLLKEILPKFVVKIITINDKEKEIATKPA